MAKISYNFLVIKTHQLIAICEKNKWQKKKNVDIFWG